MDDSNFSSAGDNIPRTFGGFSEALSRTMSGGSLAAAMDELNGRIGRSSDALAGLASSQKALEDAKRGIFGTSLNSDALAGLASSQKALEDARRGIFGASLDFEKSDLAKAVGEIQSWKGLDKGILSGLDESLSKHEIASANLRDTVFNFHDRDFGIDHLSFREPVYVPEILPNPAHKTNELLGDMVNELVEQRVLIKATADAQKRETELLGTLVEAFTATQAASDRAARRSHLQAWIAIAIALVTLLIAPFFG